MTCIRWWGIRCLRWFGNFSRFVTSADAVRQLGVVAGDLSDTSRLGHKGDSLTFMNRSKDSMPSTLIEVRRQYTPGEEVRIIESVQRALIEGFKIPDDDRCVRLVSHEPHRFICPQAKPQPSLYTVVTVFAFAGRSLDAKRNLYRAIVRNLSDEGIPPDHVKILLVEIPRENWGLAGGQVGSEIDLGFKVEV
jgi:phenylpyruvate tautomerase PptA (4-oxalocrotonate tautomerase family)